MECRDKSDYLCTKKNISTTHRLVVFNFIFYYLFHWLLFSHVSITRHYTQAGFFPIQVRFGVFAIIFYYLFHWPLFSHVSLTFHYTQAGFFPIQVRFFVYLPLYFTIYFTDLSFHTFH